LGSFGQNSQWLRVAKNGVLVARLRRQSNDPAARKHSGARAGIAVALKGRLYGAHRCAAPKFVAPAKLFLRDHGGALSDHTAARSCKNLSLQAGFLQENGGTCGLWIGQLFRMHPRLVSPTAYVAGNFGDSRPSGGAPLLEAFENLEHGDMLRAVLLHSPALITNMPCELPRYKRFSEPLRANLGRPSHLLCRYQLHPHPSCHRVVRDPSDVPKFSLAPSKGRRVGQLWQGNALAVTPLLWTPYIPRKR